MRQLFFAIVILTSICFATKATAEEVQKTSEERTGNWRFQVGLSAGEPTPLALTAGLGFKSLIFRMQGMYFPKGEDDYWTNIRGSISLTLFRHLPYNIDLGIASGYAFAEAPNGIHKALNKANNANIVYPYNYEETLDISPEITIHLYRIYTQIAIPVHFFMGNKEPTILWRAGYMLEI